LVRLERELERLFAQRQADEAAIDAGLARIAQAHAKVRGSHLKTHLATTRLLEPAQVARYAELRGYATTRRDP
jgi:Spy/CpxP family protein refolding chaperone